VGIRILSCSNFLEAPFDARSSSKTYGLALEVEMKNMMYTSRKQYFGTHHKIR
jgi:hypothetical protein